MELDGWCWWYRKYAPGDTVLEGLEKAAREAKKGLWIDSAPIPPWVYRKARRGQSLALSVGIAILDHLVLGEDRYYSFADHKEL